MKNRVMGYFPNYEEVECRHLQRADSSESFEIPVSQY